MEASNKQNWAPFVVKMLLGVIFAASAVAKIIAIDNFEIYVYSFNLMSLPAAFIVARLCIAVELLISIGLLCNIHGRFTTVCTLLALIAFSIFLCFAALTGRTDNCHCFGDLLDIDPVRSLIKNALLIIMTLVAMRAKSWEWHLPKYLWAILWTIAIAGPASLVFIVSPPDNWMFRTEQEPYNEAMLQRQLDDPDSPLHSALSQKPQLLAFYSPGCHFCRLAATKIASIQQRNGLSDSLFVNIFPETDTSRYTEFYTDTRSPRHRQLNLQRDTFLHLTYGQFPLLLLTRNGKVTATYSYRTIDEKTIAAQLKN